MSGFRLPTWDEIKKQLALSLICLLVTIPLSVFGQRVLANTHWLDSPADWISERIVSVDQNTLAWIIAGAVSLGLYLLLLWRVWKPRYRDHYHRDLTAETAPVASLKIEMTRGSRPEDVEDRPRPPDPPPTFEEEFDRLRAREHGKLKIERDKGLSEALAYALVGLWGHTFMQIVSQGIEGSATIVEDFRQRAHDGKLTVWGKRASRGIYEKIDPAFWLDNEPEWFDLLRGIARTEKTVNTEVSERFTDLMVSMTEFEKEWPHGLPGN